MSVGEKFKINQPKKERSKRRDSETVKREKQEQAQRRREKEKQKTEEKKQQEIKREKARENYRKRQSKNMENGITEKNLSMTTWLYAAIGDLAYTLSMPVTVFIRYAIYEGIQQWREDPDNVTVKKLPKTSRKNMTRKKIELSYEAEEDVYKLMDKCNESNQGIKYTFSDTVTALVNTTIKSLNAFEMQSLIPSQKVTKGKKGNRVSISLPVVLEDYLNERAETYNIPCGDYIKILIWKDYTQHYSADDYLKVYGDKKYRYYIMDEEKNNENDDQTVYYIRDVFDPIDDENVEIAEPYTKAQIIEKAKKFYELDVAGLHITREKSDEKTNVYVYKLESISVFSHFLYTNIIEAPSN